MEKNGSINSPQRRSVGVTIIGLAILILGLYKSPQSIWKIYYIIFNFPQTIRQIGFLMSILYILESSLFVCFIIGATLFLLLKKWALYLIRIALLVDALFHLFFIIKSWYFKISAYKPLIGYIILFIELVSYYLLTRPKVKALFSPAKPNT